MRWVLAILLAIYVQFFVLPAQAQSDDYPKRTITLICPFAAGGSTDILARILASELQDKLKQTVIVENRSGGGTLIGAAAVARAQPDGYTLLLAPITTLSIGPSVFKKLPYDPAKDFESIGLVASSQFVLIANPSLGVNTLPELIAYIQSKKGDISYASAGASTPYHLFMEMFLKKIDATAQHVAYRGSVPAITDVISGQIPIMMTDLPTGLPQIQAGKVKAFGMASGTRTKMAPDIPTIAEAGLPGYAAIGWFSVVAPAGTPRPVVDKLNKILTEYVVRPDVGDRMRTIGIEPMPSSPQELTAFVAAETEKWAKVVKDANIEPQ